MPPVFEVERPPIAFERFRPLLGPAYDDISDRLEAARLRLQGRTLWNLNSTATGGGVAEMLRPFLADAQGAGFRARWLVIDGDGPFFRVTKKIHNHLHNAGEDQPFTDDDRIIYESTLADRVKEVLRWVAPGDVAVINDPQPLGLAPALVAAGVTCIWRCHIGADDPGPAAHAAQEFLLPHLCSVQACVFSRAAHAWGQLDPDQVRVIPPFIDAFSPKNRELDSGAVTTILQSAGLLGGEEAYLRNPVTLVDGGKPPPPDVPLVTQVSRWDMLKDPVGVIHGFAQHVVPTTGAHLVIAGPATSSVGDDPEGSAVVEACLATWRDLPPEVQPRVHLACLPMADLDENAVRVNALQRASTVVVQKSLAEGFGLTVTEALWKCRPVVGSRVGGIQDQIVPDLSGLLVDPSDLPAFGDAVCRLLSDGTMGTALGRAGHERVRDHYLGAGHLLRWAELAAELV